MHFKNLFGLDSVFFQKPVRPLRGKNLKTDFFKRPRRFQHAALVFFFHRNQNGSLRGKVLLSRFLCLVISQAERIGQAQHFAGGPHFRAQNRVDFRIHVKGKNGLLHAEVTERFVFQIQILKLFAQHDLRGQTRHGHIADFGNQWHRARGAGIRLQNVNHIIGDGVLYVHQADYSEFHGNFFCIVIDSFNVTQRNAHRRNDTGGIAGMNTGQLDMFHDRRNKSIRAVRNRVGFRFDGVFQKLVDQNRPLRRDADCRVDIAFEHFLIMYDLHAAPAQHVGGTHHQRITDVTGHFQRLLEIAGHAGFRHGNAQFIHHHAETVAVFRQIDRLRRCSDNFHTGFGQFRSDVKRGLSAELHNHPFRFFFLVDA